MRHRGDTVRPNKHSRMARSMFISHVLSTIALQLPEVTSLTQKVPLGHLYVKHCAKCYHGCQPNMLDQGSMDPLWSPVLPFPA